MLSTIESVLESKVGLGEQCRPRSDAAKRVEH